jgi:hypothetical protein
MTSRIRLIITALLLCHLFLRPGVVTSQLPATGQQQNLGQTASQPAANPEPTQLPPCEAANHGENGYRRGRHQDRTDYPAGTAGRQRRSWDRRDRRSTLPLARNEVLIRADEQEKNQDMYSVRGHVEIRFSTNTLHCDQATYDSTTGQVTATGHVVFDGGRHNEHVVGSHATFEVSRDSGTFYDATGSTGAKVKNHMMFLTSSTPFFFTGKIVERVRARPLSRLLRICHIVPVAKSEVATRLQGCRY